MTERGRGIRCTPKGHYRVWKQQIAFPCKQLENRVISSCIRESNNCKVNLCQIIHQFLPRDYYIFVSVPFFWHFSSGFSPFIYSNTVHTNYTLYHITWMFAFSYANINLWLLRMWVPTYILKSHIYTFKHSQTKYIHTIIKVHFFKLIKYIHKSIHTSVAICLFFNN